jgi:hypothetical protein
MIHYHGLPISPTTAAAHAISAGHAFISFAHAEQLGIAVNVCQSFAVDNGAFSAWKAGAPITDWRPFYEWAEACRRIPSCDFAVIPDVIDGDEEENDELLDQWPLPRWFGTCMKRWVALTVWLENIPGFALVVPANIPWWVITFGGVALIKPWRQHVTHRLDHCASYTVFGC